MRVLQGQVQEQRLARGFPGAVRVDHIGLVRACMRRARVCAGLLCERLLCDLSLCVYV